ncbi:MAG: hypothetical protein KTR24_12540 [Saprospiraceae bacterium]|nr:hypothetical protein [Saprospiraceae bacterium]
MSTETEASDLTPKGDQVGSAPYYLYQRKKHGLWISLNMGILYAILIAIGIWSQEYVLLGMTVVISLGLIYDQLTNPQFLEIDVDHIRYRLPRKSEGIIDRSSISKIVLSPEQIRIDAGAEEPTLIEINALLSPKKRKELRTFLLTYFENVEEVER